MATSVNSGREFKLWNFTLSTSDLQIVLNDKYVNSIMIKSRDPSIDIYLRRGTGDGAYFTIPGGTTLTLDIAVINLRPFSLTAESGTPVVEILGTIE